MYPVNRQTHTHTHSQCHRTPSNTTGCRHWEKPMAHCISHSLNEERERSRSIQSLTHSQFTQETFLKGGMILFKGVTGFAFEMMSHSIREAPRLQTCNIFSKLTSQFREDHPAPLDSLRAEPSYQMCCHRVSGRRVKPCILLRRWSNTSGLASLHAKGVNLS